MLQVRRAIILFDEDGLFTRNDPEPHGLGEGVEDEAFWIRLQDRFEFLRSNKKVVAAFRRLVMDL